MPTTLTHLNDCPADEFVAAVGPIFEHSPWIAAAAVSLLPTWARVMLWLPPPMPVVDSLVGRVTGVAATRTDAAGRYTIRTRLPKGFAGFYSLTATTSGIPAGRSRLYGLIVPQ